MKLFKLFFITALMTAILGASAFAGANLPEKVRVGLYFKGSAVNSFNLASDTGFDIGYDLSGTFNSLFKDTTAQSFLVQKDNNLTEPKAAYHLQVNDAFNDYAAVQEMVAKLKAKNYKAYAAFDTKWRVWVGVYASSTLANADMAKLKKDFADNTYTLVQPSNKRVQLLANNDIKFIFASENYNFEVYPLIKGNTPNVLGLDTKKYRGSIRVVRHVESDMTVINVVNLQHYLYGVVPSEMPSSWHLEALKAQAIAARTYAVNYVNLAAKGSGKYTEIGFDVDPTINYQVYNGYLQEKESTKRAVDETNGLAAYYNNALITAYFFASDGGYTEASENVWKNPVPYLKPVEDKYQPDSNPRKNWSSKVTPAQIKEFLAKDKQKPDIGDIVDIKVTSYSKSGNALVLKVIGTKGERVYEKDNVRMFMKGFFPSQYEFLYSQTFTISKEGDQEAFVVGKDLQKMTISLNNAKILTKNGQTTITVDGPIYVKTKDGAKTLSVTKQPQTFVFNGKGHGHGVGLSQWGAKGMADAGFKFDQILKHYYTGIEVK